MIFDYGSFLMTTRNLWQVGVDYLDACKHEGASAIELLLPRIPLRNERQAFKIIGLAKKRGMHGVEHDISKVLSKRAYNDQRYGSALEWAVRSKDVLLVTATADYILKVSFDILFVCYRNNPCNSYNFSALFPHWHYTLPGCHL